VAHGRSDKTAIANAIRLAADLAAKDVCRRMGEEMEKDSALADFKHYNAVLILEELRKKWGFSSPG
jgi:hypothetical protein